MNLDVSLGIELGRRRLVLAVVRKGLRSLNPGPYLAIDDYRQLSEAEVAAQVRRFLQESGGGTENVVVSLSRQMVVTREFDFPLEVEENLKGVVAQQVAKLQPVEEAASVFGFRVVRRDPSSGRLLIQVVMARRDELEAFLDQLASWGVLPTAVIFSAASLEELLRWATREEKGQPAVRLLIRADSDEAEVLATAADGRTYSAHCERGLSGEGSVEEFLAETGRVLSPVGDEFQEFDRCWLLGKSVVERRAEFREIMSDCDLLTDRLPLAEGLPAAEAQLPAVAWGAALVGLRRGEPWCNLIPAERRVARARAAWAPTMVLASLLVVLVALLFLRGYLQQSALANEIDLQMQAIQPAAQEISRLREQLEQERAELEELAGLFRGRQTVLLVLRDLTQRLPEDTYLQNLQIQGDQVTMQGYSPQASALLPMLMQSPYLDSVKTNWIQQDARQGGLERFNFTARIKSGPVETR